MFSRKVENFRDVINEENYVYSKQMGLIRAYKKLLLWEDIINKDMHIWDKKTLINLYINGVKIGNDDYISYFNDESISSVKKLTTGIVSSSYYTTYCTLQNFNEVFKLLSLDKLIMNIEELKLNFQAEKVKSFTRGEVIDICDTLVNVQDKFIIYALFSGIKGNKYEDLLTLKLNDIDLKNKVIHTKSGQEIVIDSYLEDILTDMINFESFSNEYYKLNKSGKFEFNSSYNLNINSEYVVRVKPTKTNGNGLDHMSFQGLQTKLKSISSVLEIDIQGNALYRSGIMHRMYMIKKDWKQSEIAEFLKESKTPAAVYPIQKAFNDKYCK